MKRTTVPPKRVVKRVRTTIPRNRSGIYLIRSTVNGKVYVGSAMNFIVRKRLHFNQLKNKKHHSIHLQNHYNKYGKDDLIFGILEFCDIEDLVKREKYYFSILLHEFNVCPVPGSCLGMKRSDAFKKKMHDIVIGRKATDETKAKISAAKKGQPGTRKGQTVSEESKQKMSIAKQKMTDETKRKMSESAKIKITTEENENKRIAALRAVLKGRAVTLITRNKISKAHKGRKATEKAKANLKKAWVSRRINHTRKPLSEESKNKMRIAALNRNPISEETRSKMSEVQKGRIPWNKGLTKETDERVKKYSESLIKFNSKS